MSTDANDLAAQIFTGFAINAGPNEWNWYPIADTAIEAAKAFTDRLSQPPAPPTAQTPQILVQSDPNQIPPSSTTPDDQTQTQTSPPPPVPPPVVQPSNPS